MPQRVERPEKTEGGIPLEIEADFDPKGDQPEAIAEWWPPPAKTSAIKCCSA